MLIASVVALSFLFGLGNVWALGIRLGVPAYIAPLVAPAVDLSVVALLVATRQLALSGANRAQIRTAQRLLIFCSFATFALNTAEPIIEGHYGRAAFDAVGCCLLIGCPTSDPISFKPCRSPRAARSRLRRRPSGAELRPQQVMPVRHFRRWQSGGRSRCSPTRAHPDVLKVNQTSA
ncbi:hypothetical protein [Frankia sp. AiPs1]|uniref:hypothetical protein n=1 Tax=Frankia sp. AiPs1 TaxID=573493 RepID=UPI0035AC2488